MWRALAFFILWGTPLPRQQFNDGVAALDAGDPNRARDLLSRVTHVAPDWDLAFLELGLAEEKLGETDPTHLEPARVAFERAVKLSPSNPRANYELAMCYQAMNRHHEAVPLLQRAFSLRPQWTDAALRLGELQVQDNDIPGAVATYVALTKTPEGFVAAQTRLADLYEQQKNLVDAEAALVSVVHAQPQMPYFHYQLAQFYARNNMREKAQVEYERAGELDPRMARKKMRPLRKSAK
jgi:Tfp pilus assembly protein PilF